MRDVNMGFDVDDEDDEEDDEDDEETEKEHSRLQVGARWRGCKRKVHLKSGSRR